ncbi:hypothetical protein OH687_11595 [Burkholderia anthina]|nr:hypothetical protein OH687_11595 [Burkholderia anthina]
MLRSLMMTAGRCVERRASRAVRREVTRHMTASAMDAHVARLKAAARCDHPAARRGQPMR